MSVTVTESISLVASDLMGRREIFGINWEDVQENLLG